MHAAGQHEVGVLLPDVSPDEPPPANSRLVRLGRRRVLVCCPNQEQFGHFGVEIAFALAYARLRGVPVAFVRDPHPRVPQTLLEVEADGVEIIRGGLEHRLARAYWAWSQRALEEGVRVNVRRAASAELTEILRTHRGLPKALRAPAKEKARRLRKGSKRQTTPLHAGAVPAYNRRRLLAHGVPVHLRPEAQRRAERLAASVGLPETSRIVCLHVRERGFKAGAEQQDKETSTWDDSVRNARIETHLPAIDLLVERGFTVVRMGDPSMTPLSRPGVLDLATSDQRDPLLELWCLLHATFLFCGESGPFSVSYLTQTPMLAVNCTDPIGTFPIRKESIYMMKSVVERATGEAITGSRLFTRGHLEHLRDTLRYRFLENTPEELLAAAAEMIELLETAPPQAAAQAWYRDLVHASAAANRDLYYVRKHGPDEGYMGDGRLARVQAEAWAAAEETTAVPLLAPAGEG